VALLAAGERPLAGELPGKRRLGGASAARAAVATLGAAAAMATAAVATLGALAAVATAALALALTGLVVVMMVVMVSM
jgi:fatty acid desaturase